MQRGTFRLFLANWITKWFHASESDKEPEVQEARASFADVACKWFSKQADWLKETILQVHQAVTVLTNREKYDRFRKYKADPDAPPHRLLKFTVDLLSEKLGAPRIEEQKVIGWHVNDRLDVIVQKDQNWGTYLWMTWPIDDLVLNDHCEVYCAGRGRHSGTYMLPTLCRGHAALKVKIATPWQLKYGIGLVDAAVRETGCQSTSILVPSEI
jgi:hypothetical protein